DLAEIRKDSEVIFSLLAHAGHRDADAAESAFHAAWQQIQLEGRGELHERGQISMQVFEEALARLNTLKFSFKARLIEAAVAAITNDSMVTVTEAELLRAIGARLDCPIRTAHRFAEGVFRRRPGPGGGQGGRGGPLPLAA
ncbi:MAG: hypothetical protein R6W69_15270, partial [Anaerolineales bacterium]